MHPSPDHEAGDDRAALHAFAQSLPRESVAGRQERREAGSLRIKQALREVLYCSLCVGACTAAAALLLQPQPLLASAQIAAGIVIGAVLGGFCLPLLVLLKRVRLEVLFAEEEILDPVPFFQWNAPGGRSEDAYCWRPSQ